MKEEELFAAALDLKSPWYIAKIELREAQENKKELHLYIDHEKGVLFDYEGESCPVYDHMDRTWRHLNFFEHECYLHARVPRVKLKDKSIRQVKVPWALPGSSFTLLFEDFAMSLVKLGLSNSACGRLLNIDGRRVGKIIRYRVSMALAVQELGQVKHLSIDEVSAGKGHKYLTILSDRKRKIVVGIGRGKDAKAVEEALLCKEVRGSYREDVQSITMDMSRAFISAAADKMGQADIIFDRYHIVAKLNEALDKIRKTEQQEFKELKKSKYLFLKRAENLTSEQKDKVDYLSDAYPTLGKAYRLKEMFREVWNEAAQTQKLRPLNDWIRHVKDSGLKPMINFVNMLYRHWYGIKTCFKYLATNAFAERVNLSIQDIKRIAKGYRNEQNFIYMIYFHLGGLDLSLPIE